LERVQRAEGGGSDDIEKPLCLAVGARPRGSVEGRVEARCRQGKMQKAAVTFLVMFVFEVDFHPVAFHGTVSAL
jgi:hypothetical protein